MTNNMPSITEAEWEVMKTLWNHAPQTASQIIAAFDQQADWKPKTIRTLLDRLTKKKVVKANKEERVYTFSPLFTEEECRRAETQSFIDRIYGGTTKSMLVQFIEEEESLSKEDLQELRSLLDEKLD
ncbi:penicillinase repressor BlaI [Shouchella patagoniensis]|uniref:penicillinase repressor BlaI n=1 Tax=Shouchella patagoniensis TaxID=228576 RepID=UPI0009955645|nr:penicillinase repressor BlaI [Shouchella patagoniensis]